MTWYKCWKCNAKFDGKFGWYRHLVKCIPGYVRMYTSTGNLIETMEGWL